MASRSLGATPTVEIAPGVNMPLVNLGTWSLGNGKPSDPSVGVPAWLDAGGNGLDCAWDYFNQPAVAKEIAKSGAPRESLFITSKVPGVEDALEKVKADLKQLNVEYLDLVLLHAPLDIKAQWTGLEEAYRQNLTRAIGISNFNVKQIEGLLGYATVVPAVNQCSMGVKNHDDEVIAYCQKHGITYEAWGPIKGCNFTDPTINQIATKYSKTPAQICLRYVTDRGCVSAVGTGTDPEKAKQYSKENLDIFDFKLTPEEVAELSKL